MFRPTSTPRTKLVFSGLTGELETIPDCGSIWRCVQAATSLVPAGLQGESRRTRKVSAKSHCSGGLSQGTVAGEPGGKQRQVARAKRTILAGEVMRLAGAMQGGGRELHSRLDSFDRLGQEGEYLGRPEFAAVDAEFVGVLVGFAKGRKDLNGVRLG